MLGESHKARGTMVLSGIVVSPQLTEHPIPEVVLRLQITEVLELSFGIELIIPKAQQILPLMKASS